MTNKETIKMQFFSSKDDEIPEVALVEFLEKTMPVKIVLVEWSEDILVLIYQT